MPVTLLQTNACSPLATNAIAGNIWDNFSSQSYKDLPSVGDITWYHPYTGEPHTYTMPAGGRGYTRPPSLVSVWSTAPFLLNNSVGHHESSPSVEARMKAFQDGIEQMLWPEKREKDSLLGDRIPGKIDRTPQPITACGRGYPPDAAEAVERSPCAKVSLEAVRLGPIPIGTPINLLANVNLFSVGPGTAARTRQGRGFDGEGRRGLAALVNASEEQALAVSGDLASAARGSASVPISSPIATVRHHAARP